MNKLPTADVFRASYILKVYEIVSPNSDVGEIKKALATGFADAALVALIRHVYADFSGMLKDEDVAKLRPFGVQDCTDALNARNKLAGLKLSYALENYVVLPDTKLDINSTAQ